MRKYDIWLSAVMGVSPANGLKIAGSGLEPGKIYANRLNLADYGIFTDGQIQRAADISLESVENIRNRHQKYEIQSINCFDDNFPSRLKEIYNCPVVLFYKGDLSILENKYTVGIVGSRHCSGEGEKACGIIASDVATNGGAVISGLAQGIDTISHKSCVEAGGKTAAFIGTPIDEYFPKVNEKFQKQLEKEHLVVSEYHSGYRYFSSNFIHRNRLIAAASRGLCVIQAKKKSGSLATVNRALEYDRPVFTIPGSIFDRGYEGSNALLTENKAHRITNGAQIMEYLGARVNNKKVKKNKLPPVSDMARQVLEVITGAMFTSRIIKAAPLPAGLAKAAIIELEMAGYIKQTQTGEYIKQ